MHDQAGRGKEVTEKRIVVPSGMLKAAGAGSAGVDPYGYYLVGPLRAALEWLIGNADELIVCQDMRSVFIGARREANCTEQHCEPSGVTLAIQREAIYSSIRRIFLAPEPDETGVPEAIKDLLWVGHFEDGDSINSAIIEAYRRGQKAGAR